jgi:hypothetical protein
MLQSLHDMFLIYNLKLLGKLRSSVYVKYVMPFKYRVTYLYGVHPAT